MYPEVPVQNQLVISRLYIDIGEMPSAATNMLRNRAVCIVPK
jgi:hypothetical protein